MDNKQPQQADELKGLIWFLESYPGCLFLKDTEGRYIYASNNDATITQEFSGIIGKTELEAQLDPELGKQYYEEDMQLLKEGGTFKYCSEVNTENGNVYIEVNKSAVRGATGQIIGIIGTAVDVTKEIQLQQQLKKQYITDVVTGVYNNRYLKDWCLNEKPIYPFTLIVCDCNFLKKINDLFGHEYGDRLLWNAGDLFLKNLPETCVPVRVGGDEFLILCNDTSEEEAERLIALLMEDAKTRSVKGNALSIAYGYHTMREGELTFDECRKLADANMYSAKLKMKQTFFQGKGTNIPAYSEEMFHMIMSKMPVIMFLKDIECRYQYISNYNENHLKDKSESMCGIGLTDLELQRDAALGREYYEDDRKILETGEGSLLNSVFMEDGKERYYQIAKAAVRDEDEKIIGIVGVAMDVTETKINPATEGTAE